MRAGLVGIIFFAALLALGHYVAAPFFCRGGIMIPTLDAKALCGADLHLNRSGSVLLYFGSIGIAFFFGLLAAMPGRKKKLAEEKKAAEEKAKPSAAETFEQIVAETEKKDAAATPVVAHPSALPAQAAATPVVATPVAAAPAVTAQAPAAETPAPAATPAVTTPPMPKPVEVQAGPSPADAAVAASILSGMNAEMNAKAAAPEVKAAAAEPAAKVEPAIAETINIAAAKPVPRGPFDGTNQELLERFRELKQQENVNSIAQAQRLLDESTLSALGRGIDPKQHLSDVAHLVLKEDPDLKSGVVRGVVVHVAARLKELGVANKFPNPAKGAA
jgi:hypothetical protein